MINENKLITPVILGGDLGAYSMARAFAESLGVISYVFARDRLAICDCSVFTKLIVIKDLDKPDVATSVLIEFAKEHNEEALILVPTSDWYMKVLQYSRNDLSDYFFYIPDFKLWESLSDKSKFYEVLSEYGIDYPKSITCSEETIDSIAEKIAGLKQPYVLKPADSSLYWKYPFEGMKRFIFL